MGVSEILVLLLCLCSYAVSASSGGSYTTPKCESDNGFYCTGLIYHTCPPRTKRCTGDDSDPLCERKTYALCDYRSTTGKFRIYRHSTDLASFGSISRNIIGNPLDCIGREAKHHFITYRGFMYEFGIYDRVSKTRVQDPLDPNYEYNTRSSVRENAPLGESSCTYEQVIDFLHMWERNKYQLCSNNCQDFAVGLGNHLIRGCKKPRKRNLRSDDNSDLEYLMSISLNQTCAGSSGTSSAVPLTFVATAIVVGSLAAVVI